MFIFAIDDERDMLEELHEAIHAAEPEAELMDFETAPEVLHAIAAGAKPDVVFSDIRLPGMDGLSLAVRIREKVPEAKIVFVTGYSDYAVEAYRRHVNGYVMKPVEPGRIREELDALRAPHPVREPEDKLRVQCFGHFEVFWHGEPLLFQRRQTKELFAFLIDREGRACTSEEIAASLWEDGEDVGADKQRVRNLISDLRQTLRAIGMEEVLI
ncbi:MAG: response regulator, partial [bacterium]